MSEQCKYVAIDGSVIHFGIDGHLFLGQGDLRSYSWNANAPYGYITSFNKDDVINKSNTIYIRGTYEKVRSTANEIFNIFEKDIEYKNNHPGCEETGRLYIGDCYLKCFIISSSPACYLTHRHFFKKSISIITDYPEWIKEKPYVFCNISEEIGTKKYAYKYPYIYRSAVNSEILDNDFSTAAGFEFLLECAGNHSVTNPYLIIGEQRYQFNITLIPNEKLKVNSLSRSIVKYDSEMNTEDALYTRNKAYDIFAKIPTGIQNVLVSNDLKVTVTLLQKRSEPEWT